MPKVEFIKDDYRDSPDDIAYDCDLCYGQFSRHDTVFHEGSDYEHSICVHCMSKMVGAAERDSQLLTGGDGQFVVQETPRLLRDKLEHRR